MAFVSKLSLNALVVIVIATACATTSTTSTAASAPVIERTLSLAERLQSNESSKCWDSMLEIHSCIGEVVMFFLNGETYIGPGCCHAIRTIVHECRPTMLDSLGFTPEESHVLDDYCKGAEEVEEEAPPPPAGSNLPAN